MIICVYIFSIVYECVVCDRILAKIARYWAEHLRMQSISKCAVLKGNGFTSKLGMTSKLLARLSVCDVPHHHTCFWELTAILGKWAVMRFWQVLTLERIPAQWQQWHIMKTPPVLSLCYSVRMFSKNNSNNHCLAVMLVSGTNLYCYYSIYKGKVI